MSYKLLKNIRNMNAGLSAEGVIRLCPAVVQAWFLIKAVLVQAWLYAPGPWALRQCQWDCLPWKVDRQSETQPLAARGRGKKSSEA